MIATANIRYGGRLWDRDESEFQLSRANQRWHLQGVSDGLTDSERYTLKCITESGGMSPSELAKLLKHHAAECISAYRNSS